MTKGEWIYLIMDMTGRKFGQRTVAMHIENAIVTTLGQIFASDPQQLDFFAKQYTAAVVKAGRETYSVLPERIIQFHDFGKGVRKIYPTGSKDLLFVPMPPMGHQLFSTVQLDQVDDSVGYEVKTDKVVYFNMRYPIQEVVMELVIPFSKWSDDDDFPVPSGTVSFINDMVLKSLASMPSADNIHKTKRQE